MERPWQAVILSRPTALDDPLLFEDSEGHIFPRALKAMEGAGLLRAPVFSMPDCVPASLRRVVESWGWPCMYSPADAPQARLAQVAAKLGLDRALVLSSYSYLPDASSLARALNTVGQGQADCVCDASVSTSFFAAVNRRGLDELGRITGVVVTPTALHSYLSRRPGFQALALEAHDERARARAFLFQLLFHGDRLGLDAQLPSRYFRQTAQAELFSPQSLDALAAGLLGVRDFDAFAHGLGQVLDPQNASYVAAQAHSIKRLLPHLPARRDAFLELGFGRSTITSALLLGLFGRGTAVEPYQTIFEDCWGILGLMARHMDSLFGVPMPQAGAASRLQVERRTLEELDVAPQSLDFVFSKTVLEHVADVPALSRLLWRSLRSGGAMFHVIDHADHVDTSCIRFDFLKHDKETWRKVQKLTNVWRIRDFTDLWRDIGFDVQVVERHVRVNRPPEVHACWSDYADEDLYCHASAILARKP